jgi:hypothetical protein
MKFLIRQMTPFRTKSMGEVRLDHNQFDLFGTLWNAKDRGTFILEKGEGPALPNWQSRINLSPIHGHLGNVG